jgi:hypothetical protein
VESEVGRLRMVVLDGPGPELARLTPGNNDELLFDGVPCLEESRLCQVWEAVAVHRSSEPPNPRDHAGSGR